MLPWWLYALTPRDQSQPVMRLWSQYLNVAQVAQDITTDWLVPAEQVAIVTGWSINSIGAAAAAPWAAIQILNTQGNIVSEEAQSLFGSGVLAQSSQVSFFLVPPLYTVRIRTHWGGAPALNNAIHSFQAVLIPRGTLQVV